MYDEIEELKGKIVKKIEVDENMTEMSFFTTEGEKVTFYHEQDCCESVYIDDIVGDLDDLLDYPLVEAEMVFHKHKEGFEDTDPETWTFYKFGTIKGSVTVKWLGTSNGYYSEEVNIKKERVYEN